jgi:putative redox protein
MPSLKLEFPNDRGEMLAGLLETPPGDLPIARIAIFAHCFSCGKDVAAATRISRSLAARGIAVLRFDFTGLGNSEGDFANTRFSSNVQDLLAAARRLERDYEAPRLLIGHSLGGAAVLVAASQLPSVKAIATIGSPASADHLRHLLDESIAEIERMGEASLCLGGREFRVRRQLLDDLEQHGSAEHIARLKCALLVYHSPLDTVVPIGEAEKIFKAARHPKSFLSLDQADHLLGRPEDSEYVASTLAAWSSRYLGLAADAASSQYGERPAVAPREVIVTELDRQFLRGLFTEHHRWIADEPRAYGGKDLGPNPYDLLLMSLGACTSMTLRLYANNTKLALGDVKVRLAHKRVHEEDCEDCDGEDRRLEIIEVQIELNGDLTQAEREKLLEIAGRCPISRTLRGEVRIRERLA